MTMRKKFYIIVFLSLVISCAPKAKFIAPDYHKPERIAILPAINQTTDVDGVIVFRNLFYLALEAEDYTSLVANDIVDSLLNMQGITDGGQLATIENEELFQILNVDGLLYIELQACEYKTIGISETRLIKADFKLLGPPSDLLWEDEREEERGKSAFGSVLGLLTDPKKTLEKSGEDLKKQLKLKGAKMWLLEHELKPEMESVINKTIRTLP
jgi:hypothetical protein